MAALTINNMIKGAGLGWDVRSNHISRRLDFARLPQLTAAVDYAIIDIPAGFVPRMLVIQEATPLDKGTSVTVAFGSDGSKSVTKTVKAYGHVATVVTGINMSGAGDVVAIKVTGDVPTKGIINVSVVGDFVDGAWNDAEQTGLDFDPASRVKNNTL